MKLLSARRLVSNRYIPAKHRSALECSASRANRMRVTDPKERFSSRAEDYARYRPGYPREILDVLRNASGLTSESVVVDVGSGTGLLAQLFLSDGNRVYGVEPNAAMREAGAQFLNRYPRFSSVAGAAGANTL